MGVVDNMVHTESSRVTSLSNVSHSEEKLGRMPLQNGHVATLSTSQLKYKRRRVSAVRDFPPGCGRAAAHFSLESGTETARLATCENLVNGDQSSELKRNDSVQSSGAEAEFSAREVSETMVPRELIEQQNNLESTGEKLAVSSDQMDVCAAMRPQSHQVDGLEQMKMESAELPLPELVLLHTVDVVKNSDEMVVHEQMESRSVGISLPKDEPGDITAMSSHSNQVDFAEQKEEKIALQCLSQSYSLPDGPISGLYKAVTRKYPPRRMVSAVRDFPPYTGSNVSPLSQEQIREIVVPAKNKNLALQKSGNEDMQSKAYKKQTRLYIPDGTSVSGILNKLVEQDTKEKSEESACGDNASGVNSRSEALKENIVKDIEVYDRSQNLGRELSDLSVSMNQSQEDFESFVSQRVIVIGLKAGLRAGLKKAQKPNVAIGKNKGKKHVAVPLQPKPAKRIDHNSGEDSGGTCSERNLSPTRGKSQDMQIVVWNKEDSHDYDAKSKDLHVAQRPRKFNVRLPPSRPVGSVGTNKDTIGIRNKVKEILRLFQAICRKLLQEEEAKPRASKNAHIRVDYQASRILKDKGKLVNTGKQIIGHFPGIEVGDEFQYRVELNMIGLHKQIQGGIDWVKERGKILATSIVASGGYDDELDNSDVLIYTGQGGNVNGGKEKEPEDQKLERGNLALVNSKHAKNHVRVIRGDSKEGTYIYDGLYLVEDFWQEMGPHGKLVFKFKLHRLPGQPELSWTIVKKSKKSKFREGLCKLDISEGKEGIPIDISEGKEEKPIFALNTIDDEKPPPFIYTVGMIYPDWCRLVPPRGCDCTTGCSESGECPCVVKNGGEIPYNHDGAIVEAKSLVYECGPSCKCPRTCYNRVTQRGIKFQLEVFKTDSRGWGVRSLNSIPSGSFICEYAGELLEDKEAERRTGNDEYLFDIGNNYTDNSLWDGVSKLMRDSQSSSCQIVDESGGFTIDAARYGNIGRFINHSCSPNLYAQNVLYDHEDTRIPHVMFFAMDNIPPLQELTYDYNYMIDQVRDSNGNVKKKDCYCGSSECTGRLY